LLKVGDQILGRRAATPGLAGRFTGHCHSSFALPLGVLAAKGAGVA
jgi:hypothetical protein